MGYTTDFEGCLEITGTLLPTIWGSSWEEFQDNINSFADTRHMASLHPDLPKRFGLEGSLLHQALPEYEKYYAAKVLGNDPPEGVPGLWCQWVIDSAQDTVDLCWDGGEKFYNYIEWLLWLIREAFEPAGLLLNGMITWQGASRDDYGTITVENNAVYLQEGSIEDHDPNELWEDSEDEDE